MLDFQQVLNLPEIKVLDSQIDEHGDVVIEIESTRPDTKCRRCNRRIDRFYDRAEPIRLRHLDVFGRRCFLELRPKRFKCPHCKGGKTQTITTQRLSWYRSGSQYTKAFEAFCMLMLVSSTVADVSKKFDIGRSALFGLIDRQLEAKVDWQHYESLELIGLDEIALRKGHGNFVTLVTTLVEGQVEILAVLEDRKKDTVKEFLSKLPERLKRTVKEVCVDMYRHFASAIRESLPTKVKITADRFHVAKAYRECADKLRKKELRRLKEELSKEESDEVKGAMWAFRSDLPLENMDPNKKEAKALKRLLELSPELAQARELRLELTGIFERIDSKEGAKIAIGKWRAKVKRSGLRCFESFVTTLGNWWEEITNYFENFNSSGFVEGFNNKVKVLKRRCFGLLRPTSLFKRLRLDFEGYKRFKPAILGDHDM